MALIDTEKLRKEIKQQKEAVDGCTNTDYLTGYLSALSFCEGAISEIMLEEEK
jgi:hypothetical protein